MARRTGRTDGEIKMTWIQTHTGKAFDLLNPSPDDICIEDIAHALSMICRFNGHCHNFYSVAEHSILVSFCVHGSLALEGLLHDAAEAYIGDMVSPLKNSIPLEPYREIEHDVRYVISEKFGLATSVPRAVKEVDQRMLATERDQLMGAEVKPWFAYEIQIYEIDIACHDSRTAKQKFLVRFRELEQSK